MAAHNYAEDQADAAELIEEFGKAGSLREMVKTGPTYDPTLTPSDHTVTFAVLDYDVRQIDGARILATDKLVYLSAVGLTIEPKPGHMLVENDGGLYNVVNARPLKPGATVVFYEVQVRR